MYIEMKKARQVINDFESEGFVEKMQKFNVAAFMQSKCELYIKDGNFYNCTISGYTITGGKFYNCRI